MAIFFLTELRPTPIIAPSMSNLSTNFLISLGCPIILQLGEWSIISMWPIIL